MRNMFPPRLSATLNLNRITFPQYYLKFPTILREITNLIDFLTFIIMENVPKEFSPLL